MVKRKPKPKPKPPPKGVGPAAGQEDVEAFLEGLNPRHKTCPSSVLGQLIRYKATGCIAALLERKISHNRLDLNCKIKENDEDRYGDPPMEYAAWHGFHEGLQLFIRHGGAAAIVGARLVNSAIRGGKSRIRGEADTLSNVLVALSECPDWWHTVRLVAGAVGDTLEGEIRRVAVHGCAPDLFWFLVTLPDRVLSPEFSGRVGHVSADCEGGHVSLRNLLTAQLAFLAGESALGRGCDWGVEHAMQQLTSTLLLLELFQRVGPQYLSCVASIMSKEKGREDKELSSITREIEGVMKGAGGIHLDRVIYRQSGWTTRSEAELDRHTLRFVIRESTTNTACRSKVLDSDFNRTIEKLCSHPYVKEWNGQKSPLKLLFIFCLPDLVEKMRCYMSPFSLESVDPASFAELCFVYINEGRVAEFAAALMAVRVVLRLEHPLQRRDDHDHGHKSPPTVYEFLLYAMKTVVDEEISLAGKSEDDDLVKACKEKKSAISSAILLTQVFEQPAQYIHWYLRSTTYKKHKDFKKIVDDVVSLLKDSGVELKREDICVDDLECFSSNSGVISDTSSKTDSSSSVGPHRGQMPHSCVKGQEAMTGLISKSVMSTATTSLESSLGANYSSSIGKLSTRSYHSSSLPISSYGGSSRINSIAKRVDAAKWSSDPGILRNKISWRFLTMIKRIMMRL